MVKNDAEKLVKAFGTGFILKKNLNSVMTANVGEEWVEAVRRLEAASPRHFAATFSETYSRPVQRESVLTSTRRTISCCFCRVLLGVFVATQKERQVAER